MDGARTVGGGPLFIHVQTRGEESHVDLASIGGACIFTHMEFMMPACYVAKTTSVCFAALPAVP